MTLRLVFLIIWIVLLALAYPYVQRARHPASRPLAAYLIFVTVFSAAAIILFFTLNWLVGAIVGPQVLGSLYYAPIAVAAVFGLAFLIARWQLRRPPRQAPPLP